MSLRTLTAFLVAIAIGLTTQTAFAPPVTTPAAAVNDTATTPVNTPVLIAGRGGWTSRRCASLTA